MVTSDTLLLILHFLRSSFIYKISSFSILHPNPPTYPSLLSTFIVFFSLIVIRCIYVYKCIYIYIYIPRYNLFRPYTVTCLYVLSADRLPLDSQFVCSSPGKTTFLAHSFPKLHIVLCVGLRPNGLFPVQFGMLIGVNYF